ncbi:hypothetical protein I550_3859 [Mycobacterium intracellulare 1956]|uniref:Uncharacterized protein n=1 Tax=Mycobacterium intracellulare 1956 TaxID=1299331 RepID=X8CHY4_MYCIT|nr:hypothetical protein I550_3859 [Mycobacterium intracellulare 1956]
MPVGPERHRLPPKALGGNVIDETARVWSSRALRGYPMAPSAQRHAQRAERVNYATAERILKI